MTGERRFDLDEGVEALLRVVEGSHDEAARIEAIDRLADAGSRDACRVLIEAYERSAWRETRIALLHALGRMGMERGFEVLVRVVADERDLALGAEAVLALGGSDSAAVGELLASLVAEGDAAHRREAIIALSRQSWPSSRLLARALGRARSEGATGLVQYLVIGLGIVGSTDAWPLVEGCLLEPDCPPAVFNAALVAAGRLSDADGARRLEALDVRFRFFAQQLKGAALAHARVRARLSIEDAVEAVRLAVGRDALREGLQLLASFPFQEAREAFAVLAEDASAELRCAVRAALSDAAHVPDDLAFLGREAERLAPEAAATLAIALRELEGERALGLLHAELPAQASRALMARVREAAAVDRLSVVVASESEPNGARIDAVNALVAQARMVPPRAPHAARIGEEVRLLARRVASPEVRHRLIRALGQLQVGGDAALSDLGKHLRPGAAAFGSSAYALSLLGTDDASRVLLARFATPSGGPQAAAEVGQLLGALARMGALPPTSVLDGVTATGRRERLALLQILAHNRVSGHEALLLQSAGCADFTERLLAIAAARHNYAPPLREPLLAAFHGDTPSLAQRALDSLCVSGDAAVYAELLTWAFRPGAEAADALKVLRSVTVEPGAHSELVALLDAALRERPQVTTDPDVVAAAVHLRDLLDVGDGTTTAGSGDGAHTLDAELAARLPGYPRYSEAAKSVLRNAELTVGRTDLFDDRVDKSTILIEYVKSIDLVLQEKIGATMFPPQGDGGDDVLKRMRSRIVQLGLDDDSRTAPALIELLRCGQDFRPEVLPVQKVVALCRAILTGRIERAPYRIIDGLRAWAMVLLVFGRELQSGGVTVEPVLGLHCTDDGLVSRLAADLNHLQHIRNEAAHRGTVRRMEDLTAARDLALKVLVELDAVI